MNKNLFLTGIIIGVIFISGCIYQQNYGLEKKGFLKGKVTIGPLCPVVQKPPSNQSCQPSEETYRAWPVAIWRVDRIIWFDRKTKVARIQPEVNGTYKTKLPAGKYIVDLEKKPLRTGSSNLPVTVTIRPLETTKLDIEIDTGVR